MFDNLPVLAHAGVKLNQQEKLTQFIGHTRSNVNNSWEIQNSREHFSIRIASLRKEMSFSRLSSSFVDGADRKHRLLLGKQSYSKSVKTRLGRCDRKEFRGRFCRSELTARLVIDCYKGFYTVCLIVNNPSLRPVRIKRVNLIESLLPESGVFFENPYKARALRIDYQVSGDTYVRDLYEGEALESSLFSGVYAPKTDSGFICGFLECLNQIPAITCHLVGQYIQLGARLDGEITLAPKGEHVTETWVCFPRKDYRALLQYGKLIKRQNKVHIYKGVISGWCSWGYYFGNINAKAVEDNLNILCSKKDLKGVDIVQIDDGYQAKRNGENRNGDWLTANEKFDYDLGKLFSKVIRKGKKPGIWLAPFLVGPTSDLAQNHPEWLLKNSSNTPVKFGSSSFVIDPTKPDALDYILNIFRSFIKTCGCKYFKLDYVNALFTPGAVFSSGDNAVQAYRKTMLTIRKTVPDDIPILMGTARFAPSIGLASSLRTGPDNFPHWQMYEDVIHRRGDMIDYQAEIFRSALLKQFLHNRAWISDPDQLLIRSPNSEDEAEQPRSEYTYLFRSTLSCYHECETLASLMAFGGGSFMLGDKISVIEPKKLRMISKLLPVYPEGCYVVDIFNLHVPSTLVINLDRDRAVVLLTNWYDTDQQLRCLIRDCGITKQEVHAVDFWSGKYLGVFDKEISLAVAPHASKLLILHSTVSVPTLIASTHYFAQAAHREYAWQYKPESKVLCIEADSGGRPRQGAFFVACPPGYRIIRVQEESGERVNYTLQGNIVRIRCRYGSKRLSLRMVFDN